MLFRSGSRRRAAILEKATIAVNESASPDPFAQNGLPANRDLGYKPAPFPVPPPFKSEFVPSRSAKSSPTFEPHEGDCMRLAMFEDQAAAGLVPIAWMRPVCELLCGQFSLRERLLRGLSVPEWGVFVRPFQIGRASCRERV